MKKTLLTLILLICSLSLFAAFDISANDMRARNIRSSYKFPETDVTIMATASKAVTVEAAPEAKSADGETYTMWIKLNGTGNQDQRSVRFAAAKGEVITVTASSSAASSDRTLNVVSEDGAIVGTIAALKGDLDATAGSVTIPEDGVYYLISKSGGINIYRMILK